MASRGTAVLGSYPLDFFFLGLGGSLQREAARIPFYTCAHIYYKYEQVNMLHFRFLDHS